MPLVLFLAGGFVLSYVMARAGAASRPSAPVAAGAPGGTIRMKLVGQPKALGLSVPCIFVPNALVAQELAKAGLHVQVWSDPADLPRDWPRDERGHTDPSACTFFAQGTLDPRLNVPQELRALWRA